METRAIGYWASTSILALEALVGGVVGLTNGREMVVAGRPIDDVMAHLGYPVYFARILGIWEVLAGIALLAPRFPRLKEWAYAGIFFNMTGAAASRAVRGDDVSHIVAPLAFAGLAVASWALRPQSRSLGVPSPAERRAQASNNRRRTMYTAGCNAVPLKADLPADAGE